MDKKTLAKRIHEVSYLTGEFKLRSGQISKEYFDKYQFEADPKILAEIAKKLLPLIPPRTQVLGGLEVGGIPIATALSLVSGLPVAFVRKEAKKYGTQRLAEGADICNKHVTLVEDVITTGGQVILSAQDLIERGAIVKDVLCVINRGGEEAEKKLSQKGLKLKSLFVKSDF